MTVDILLKPDEIKNTTISGKIRDIITVKKFFSDNYKIYDNNKLIFEYKSEDVKKNCKRIKRNPYKNWKRRWWWKWKSWES